MNDCKLFYNGLICAQNILTKNLEEINKINIFPVADGDTGTNLLLSIENIYVEIDKNLPIHTQLQEFVSALFTKASGNSGFILSLLLTEVSGHIIDSDGFSPRKLGTALLKAAYKAKEQIENYVDGSMISFSEDLGNLLIESEYDYWDKKLYEHLSGSFKLILEQTRIKNPLLSSSDVVDAGALGLCYWFTGLFSSLCQVSEIYFHSYNKEIINSDSFDCETISTQESPNFRYCVQATLSLQKKNRDIIDEILMTTGDCNLNIFQKNIMRFHLHTDKTQDLFYKIMKYSVVKSVKIDDMVIQYEASQGYNKIAIVTDSSADIPYKIKEKYKINVIPLCITQGEQKMLDGLTVNPESLARHIESNTVYPKTSSPTLGSIEKLFKLLSSNHQHVIAISISSKMSGTFNSFSRIAKSFANVSVIDSKRNSGAHGLVVSEIARMAHAGQSAKNILEVKEKVISSKNIYVLVNDFSAMLKSGRVSKAKAWISNKINLKPVVGIDNNGKGVIVSKTLSRRKQFKSLLKILKEKNDKAAILGFKTLHVDNYENAKQLDKQISEIFKIKSYGILQASPVISLHAGKGTLAVAIDQGV